METEEREKRQVTNLQHLKPRGQAQGRGHSCAKIQKKNVSKTTEKGEAGSCGFMVKV